jgi:hypothetical protein
MSNNSLMTWINPKVYSKDISGFLDLLSLILEYRFLIPHNKGLFEIKIQIHIDMWVDH